ncbi:DUF1772 domain-containing protein [Streptomyces sp. M-16]|uniref:DUF1772 domain-containing protein n=1 Tax=Streptomyces sp. M-16 TaxID=3233040 RepID=UPI003F9475A6
MPSATEPTAGEQPAIEAPMAAERRGAAAQRPVTAVRRTRLLRALALFSTGLLAGAFGYGAANLVPTFNAVPIGMRLGFHAELMKMNGITMQATMAVSALSTLALAASVRGRARVLAGAAGLLTVSSFLITRFGNVPINGRIKQWAATSPPPGHAEVLRRWELFNDARTATAVLAFGLLIALTHQRSSAGPAPHRLSPPASSGRRGDPEHTA